MTAKAADRTETGTTARCAIDFSPVLRLGIFETNLKEKMTKTKTKTICPYCGKPAVRVGGNVIYPHRPDLSHKEFYLCSQCDAYVGCHPDSHRPLGRLANRELRRLKMLAHEAFDPIWRSGYMKRNAAYAWLAGALGISVKECHIGEMDVAMCVRVIGICKQMTEQKDNQMSTSTEERTEIIPSGNGQERHADAARDNVARDEAARQRMLSLRPDKEKLMAVATWLENLEMPEVSADSFDLAQSVHAVVYRACGEIRQMLELAQ